MLAHLSTVKKNDGCVAENVRFGTGVVWCLLGN